MNKPTVCCICLTKDRPTLLAHAVECFRRQTYANKRLLVYNTGDRETAVPMTHESIECWSADRLTPTTIGGLRNSANGLFRATGRYLPDIFIHWDDDDHSHPDRIAEQVELLQSSGADVVGYNQMLFFDERADDQAWLYTGEILGTSLCYWREIWERTPFAANHILNEDGGFVSEVRSKGGKVKSVPGFLDTNYPAMIARIHPGNMRNPAYRAMEYHPHHWRRVPIWDAYCREEMRR